MNEATRISPVFYWMMMLFALMDILLLFWILNPLSGPSKQAFTPGSAPAYTAAAYGRKGDDLLKPSPLGAVSKKAAARPAGVRLVNASYNGR